MLWTWQKTETVARIAFVCFVVSHSFSWLFSLSCLTSINFFLLPFLLISAAFLFITYSTVDPEGRGVLVTGCDTGFGLATALQLDKLGFTVYAGCLMADSKEGGAQKLRQEGSSRMHVVQLNITSQQEIQQAVTYVKEHLPTHGLWGIINNAGWSTYGELEWVPMETFRRIMEINLFGTIGVTKGFLPLLRKSKGRIVNVTSVLGRMTSPMRSPYVATKFALEGLSDVLRYEMQPWGVHVCCVEPGNFIAGTALYTTQTIDSEAKKMWDSMSEEVRADYGKDHFDRQVQNMHNYCTSGIRDITLVLNSFEEALTQRFPLRRYHAMDLEYQVRLFTAAHLPEWVYEYFYVKFFKRNGSE